MVDKSRLITPFLMLTAGTIASIIMYVRKFELNTMLWGLLIVLVIFYILGDVARYLYESVKPRVIPSGNLAALVEEARRNGDLTGNVVAFADDEAENGSGRDTEELGVDGLMSEEEGYSEEELGGYDEEAAEFQNSDEENSDGE